VRQLEGLNKDDRGHNMSWHGPMFGPIMSAKGIPGSRKDAAMREGCG